MKKIVNLIGFLFIFTTILSILGVRAGTYMSYVGFNLPSWQGTINAGTLTKSDYLNHVVGVLSSKDTRDVNIRLTGNGVIGYGTSAWQLIEITKNSTNTTYSHVRQINTSTSANAYGMTPGNVIGTMKARNTYLDSTYFNGTWFVSVTVYNQLNPNNQI